MATRVDHAGVVSDLRVALASAPRTSWGRGQLLLLIAEIEAENRVTIDADDAAILHAAGVIADTALGRSRAPD